MAGGPVLELFGRDVRKSEEYPSTDGTELLTLVSPIGRAGRNVEGQKPLDSTIAEVADRIGVPTLISFSALRHVNPEKVGDWDPSGATDNTDTLIAAQAAAAANNLYIDGQGDAIGVAGSATIGFEPGTDLRLRNISVKDLNPGDTSRRTIYASGLDRVFLDHVTFDKNGDGTGGGLGSAASAYFSFPGEFVAEYCKFTGNDAGSGLVITDAIQPRLLFSDFYDLYYEHVSQSDDQVQGSYMIRCVDFLTFGCSAKRMGRIDQTSASRHRFSRPFVYTGCSGQHIGNVVERADVGMDITGGIGDRLLLVQGNISRHVATFGLKSANTGLGVQFWGNIIEHAGWAGVCISGPSVADIPNYTADNIIATNIIKDIGTNGLWTGSSPTGVLVLKGLGTIGQQSPSGVSVRGNKIASPTKTSLVTIFDTDELNCLTPLKMSIGQVVRFTTSGTLPTGLALSTDYFLIPQDDTYSVSVLGGRVKVAASYNDAVDGTAITGFAGGSGNHTMTQTSKLVYGGRNEVVFSSAYDPVTWHDDNTVKGNTGVVQSGFHESWAQAHVNAQSIPDDGTNFTDVQVDTLTSVSMGQFSVSVPDILIPITGRYRLVAEINWTANATGLRSLEIQTNIAGGGYSSDGYTLKRDAGSASTGPAQQTEIIGKFTTADKLKVRVRQNSGGALNVLIRVTLIQINE